MVAEPLSSSFSLRPIAGKSSGLQLTYTCNKNALHSRWEDSKAQQHLGRLTIGGSLTLDTSLPFSSKVVSQHRLEFTHCSLHKVCTRPHQIPFTQSQQAPSSVQRRSSVPFEDITRRQLPSDFEPPADAPYWKGRCFHWQQICQQGRKRLREMEEDQRQLRQRIARLEDQVLSRDEDICSTPRRLAYSPERRDDEHIARIPLSPISDRECRRHPPLEVSVPSKSRHHSCFYLTDGEGLSDSEDYIVDLDDDETSDIEYEEETDLGVRET